MPPGLAEELQAHGVAWHVAHGTWHGAGAVSRRAWPSLRPAEPPGAGPAGAEPPPSEAGWLSPLEIRTGMGGEEPEWARGRDGRAGLERSRCPQGTPVCPCAPPVPSCPATPQAGAGAASPRPRCVPCLPCLVWWSRFGIMVCPLAGGGALWGHSVPRPSPHRPPVPPYSAKLGLGSCACRCRRPGVVNRGDRR